jgi:soluble lytic murein transglycosylase-like protein
VAELDTLIALCLVGAGAVALGPGGGLDRLKNGPKAQGAIAGFAAKWGPVFGVPAPWILAICKVESNFRPGATNLTSAGDVKRGGAWGCMQVTLATAQGLAGGLAKHGSPLVAAAMRRWTGSGEALLDPDLGVMFGACLLGNLRRELGDNFEAVATAYNRGVGNVKKLIAANRPATSSYAQKAAAALTEVA